MFRLPEVSVVGFGRQLLNTSRNNSDAANAPSDLLSVRCLKSQALSDFARARTAAATFRLRGFRGLYHTFACSGKKWGLEWWTIAVAKEGPDVAKEAPFVAMRSVPPRAKGVVRRDEVSTTTR